MKFTDEQIAWLKQHKETPPMLLTPIFNQIFNESRSKSSIVSFRKRHGLVMDCGHRGEFKKGQVPWNKGKSYRLSPASEFKKGSVPKNHRPLGSEQVDKDGYIMLKVAEPNKWMRKHRHIYQNAHGEVPKGHVIVFVDGNKRNFELSNLMMISCAENATFNIRGYSKLPSELQITARLKTKLDYELSKITGLIEGYFDHTCKHNAGKQSRNKQAA